MQCSLCGHKFDAQDGQCTPACPMAGGCTMICCPSCGFGMPDESRSSIVRVGRKVLSALRRTRPGGGDTTAAQPGGKHPAREPGPPGNGNGLLPLSRLRPGSEAWVVRIGTENARRLENLSDLGIAPGGTLRLLRKGSTSVVRVDETEVALDSDIARQIYVQIP